MQYIAGKYMALSKPFDGKEGKRLGRKSKKGNPGQAERQ